MEAVLSLSSAMFGFFFGRGWSRGNMGYTGKQFDKIATSLLNDFTLEDLIGDPNLVESAWMYLLEKRPDLLRRNITEDVLQSEEVQQAVREMTRGDIIAELAKISFADLVQNKELRAEVSRALRQLDPSIRYDDSIVEDLLSGDLLRDLQDPTTK